jgi:hypothetical protein
MARLAPAIAEAVGKPVLSSPRSGAEDAVRVLNQQAAEPVHATARAFETMERQRGCGAR